MHFRYFVLPHMYAFSIPSMESSTTIMDAAVRNASSGNFRQQTTADGLLMPSTGQEPFSTGQIISIPQFLHQHSADEWESLRPEITRLYVDEKLPLHTVISTMKVEHGFFGT
jgi:hypothetical protein